MALSGRRRLAMLCGPSSCVAGGGTPGDWAASPARRRRDESHARADWDESYLRWGVTYFGRVGRTSRNPSQPHEIHTLSPGSDNSNPRTRLARHLREWQVVAILGNSPRHCKIRGNVRRDSKQNPTPI